jgi:hypothetical protein
VDRGLGFERVPETLQSLGKAEKILICVHNHEPPKQPDVTMKYVCVFFFFLTAAQAEAQLPKLEPSNPAPRQGEEVNINFLLKDGNADIGSGNFKVRQPLADTGLVTIGPFQFSINNKSYSTGTITLHVYPKLPDNIHEGIWIRYVAFEGKYYLITEQRIPADQKKKPEGNSIVIGGEAPFAELDRDQFEQAGLKVVNSNSYTDSGPMGKDEVSYKLTTYRFEKTAYFKGRLRLDKKFFTDFPEKVITSDVWIAGN